MANLTPSATFDDVQQLETTTVALGGPGAPMNLQAQALLNRTQYLYVQLSNLSKVASTGDYNDLANRPSLGSAAFQNSSAFATAQQGAKADGAAQASSLSTVAFSGSYNDLTNKLTFAAGAGISINVVGSNVTITNTGGGGGSSFVNPMTTVGDLIIGGTGGAPTRLATGTATYVLTSNGPGTPPSWQAATATAQPTPFFGSMFGDTDVPHGYKLTKKGKVITVGASGSWKEARIEGPQCFWDPIIGKYRLVYLGYSGTKASPNQSSIGFATADNPAGPWTEYASNPVLPPSGVSGAPDQNGCSAPHVWFEGGTYYLFYLGLTATGLEQGNKSICLATSTDFLTWTRHGAVILPQASTWRASAVWHPNVVKRGSLYYLFFNANVGNETIGYATSTDLMTWTVDDTNSPVLTKSVSGWDSSRVGDPFLWRKGDVWYMSYYGAGPPSDASQEGLAWTYDKNFPLGWTKYSGNPIIANTSGSFDSHDAGRGAVLVTPSRTYHWYTTGDGATPPTIEIAVAVDDSLALGVQSIVQGTGVTVDNTDPKNPVISATGGGVGGSFVGCRAQASGTTTVPANTSTIIPFNSEDFDTSNIHDPVGDPSHFTVPSGMSGHWRVTFRMFTTSGGTIYGFVRKNGATDSQNTPGAAAGGVSQVYIFNSFLMNLVAGDVLALWVFSTSGTTVGSSGDTGLRSSFEMEYLG